jgi:hypothetical protein
MLDNEVEMFGSWIITFKMRYKKFHYAEDFSKAIYIYERIRKLIKVPFNSTEKKSEKIPPKNISLGSIMHKL